MKRRGGTGDKTARNHPRKAVKRHSRSPTTQAALQARIDALEQQLTETLEQQTATSEVLKVISSSLGKLETVFDAMLENAKRICGAEFGNLLLFDGQGFRAGAMKGNPKAYIALFNKGPLVPGPHTALGRLVRTRQIAHVEDVSTGRASIEHDPLRMATIEVLKARSLLAVPMLKDGGLIGAIILYRQEVRAFTDKQIELVQNFAAQAVIAIENTRLLSELRQRTDDLTESLEQQTATSEVLKTILSSPGALEPVFQAMLQNATRLCDAKFGSLFRFENGVVHSASRLGIPPSLTTFFQQPQDRVGPLNAIGRVRDTRRAVHIPDYREDVGYYQRDPIVVASVERGGIRTLLMVPMLKDDQLIGAFGIYRQEVRPFTDKQIELVQNFAAQAVIAIENTRLLSELRQRTGDLGESLERQTATSEVLNVISNSVNDAQPVFNAIVQSALKLFPDAAILIALRDGETLRAGAFAEADAERAKTLLSRWPIPLTRQYNHAIAILDRRIIDIPDAREAPPELSAGSQYFLTTGYRAITGRKRECRRDRQVGEALTASNRRLTAYPAMF